MHGGFGVSKKRLAVALIKCPECKRRISDKAESCPGCGFQLQKQTATVADLLSGRRWRIRSETLGAGRTLDADFSHDGNFSGMLTAPAGDFFVKSQQVSGKWHLAPPLLLLAWDWIQSSGPYHEEVPIEISSASDQKLQGVDKWFRLWELEKIKG